MNLCEHDDGKGPKENLSLGRGALGAIRRSVRRPVPRVPRRRDPAQAGRSSQVPDGADSRTRICRTSRSRASGCSSSAAAASTTTFDPRPSFDGPWGIKTDGGDMLNADFGRISAAPRLGTREIWTLKNGGGGWDHPIHIHFEEGQILARNGSAANVPPASADARTSTACNRAAPSRSPCSSATSRAPTWSTATTRCTKTTRCCCGGTSIRDGTAEPAAAAHADSDAAGRRLRRCRRHPADGGEGRR